MVDVPSPDGKLSLDLWRCGALTLAAVGKCAEYGTY